MNGSINLNLEVKDDSLERLADLVAQRLEARGLLQSAKLWLTMEEAVEVSGLSEWEIRKRVKAGVVEKHQPNPGRPPLKISRISLLRSMGSVIESDAIPQRKEA